MWRTIVQNAEVTEEAPASHFIPGHYSEGIGPNGAVHIGFHATGSTVIRRTLYETARPTGLPVPTITARARKND